MPLRHSADAFSRQVTAAFIRWNTWLLSQGWAMIEQLSQFSRQNSMDGLDSATVYVQRDAAPKVMSKHSWLIIFSAIGTGCHFGCRVKTKILDFFLQTLIVWALSEDLYYLTKLSFCCTLFRFLTVGRHTCSYVWIGKTEIQLLTWVKKSQDYKWKINCLSINYHRDARATRGQKAELCLSYFLLITLLKSNIT